MLGIQPKFQTYEKQKNRENKAPKVKQSHAQDSIYVVRQFTYVHRVAGISLLSKKITMCSSSIEVLTFVSTATTERAFSTMKLLKTRFRNRMEDEFLADNMIVYIEKEIAGNFTKRR